MVHEIRIVITEEEKENKIIIEGFVYLKKEVQEEVITSLQILKGDEKQ